MITAAHDPVQHQRSYRCVAAGKVEIGALFEGRYDLGACKKHVYLHLIGREGTCSYSSVTQCCVGQLSLTIRWPVRSQNRPGLIAFYSTANWSCFLFYTSSDSLSFHVAFCSSVLYFPMYRTWRVGWRSPMPHSSPLDIAAGTHWYESFWRSPSAPVHKADRMLQPSKALAAKLQSFLCIYLFFHSILNSFCNMHTMRDILCHFLLLGLHYWS